MTIQEYLFEKNKIAEITKEFESNKNTNRVFLSHGKFSRANELASKLKRTKNYYKFNFKKPNTNPIFK